MSFRARIAELNGGRTTGLLPFLVDGRTLGWLRPGRAALLAPHAGVFDVREDRVRLSRSLEAATPEARTDAVARVLAELRGEGHIAGWRDEFFPVTDRFGAPAALLIERAAVAMFGVRGFGVHVNGIVRGDDAPRMWVARRAAGKPTWPGLLDQLVAGGQPAGLGLRANVEKECAEEAGIPPPLARRARAAGAVSYCMDTPEGIRPDLLFVFDLELPSDFVPHNADGEVERFECWALERVARTVAETSAFKPNCALVALDFLVRDGYVSPEDADYEAIVSGLHPPPPAASRLSL